ncbi:hypothetical protein ACQBAT_01190 [Ornithinimicrobium sp. Y1847]|uniref:hypothetical protein n=1 Tax=Ornithinimicrobium sp. Y1847 TaxID=3405419 RepID=UPI003B67B060
MPDTPCHLGANIVIGQAGREEICSAGYAMMACGQFAADAMTQLDTLLPGGLPDDAFLPGGFSDAAFLAGGLPDGVLAWATPGHLHPKLLLAFARSPQPL